MIINNDTIILMVFFCFYMINTPDTIVMSAAVALLLPLYKHHSLISLLRTDCTNINTRTLYQTYQNKRERSWRINRRRHGSTNQNLGKRINMCDFDNFSHVHNPQPVHRVSDASAAGSDYDDESDADNNVIDYDSDMENAIENIEQRFQLYSREQDGNLSDASSASTHSTSSRHSSRAERPAPVSASELQNETRPPRPPRPSAREVQRNIDIEDIGYDPNTRNRAWRTHPLEVPGGREWRLSVDMQRPETPVAQAQRDTDAANEQRERDGCFFRAPPGDHRSSTDAAATAADHEQTPSLTYNDIVNARPPSLSSLPALQSFNETAAGVTHVQDRRPGPPRDIHAIKCWLCWHVEQEMHVSAEDGMQDDDGEDADAKLGVVNAIKSIFVQNFAEMREDQLCYLVSEYHRIHVYEVARKNNLFCMRLTQECVMEHFRQCVQIPQIKFVRHLRRLDAAQEECMRSMCKHNTYTGEVTIDKDMVTCYEKLFNLELKIHSQDFGRSAFNVTSAPIKRADLNNIVSLQRCLPRVEKKRRRRARRSHILDHAIVHG
jgi:hypothetical protein